MRSLTFSKWKFENGSDSYPTCIDRNEISTERPRRGVAYKYSIKYFAIFYQNIVRYISRKRYKIGKENCLTARLIGHRIRAFNELE